MTHLIRDGYRIAYWTSGRVDGPAVVFSHSLGLDAGSWDAQVPRLEGRYRVVRFDTRGHGRSGAPTGPYTVAGLAADLLAVADHLRIDRFHLVGLSLGGLLAQWLAVHRPERLRSAVLCNTTARLGSADLWNARIAAVEAGGMEPIADQIVARFFSGSFGGREPETLEKVRATLVATSPRGYAACCAALRDEDLRGEVGRIRVPSLVVGGSEDAATPPATAEWLCSQIPSCELVILEGAGHVSNVERPEAFEEALTGFLARR